MAPRVSKPIKMEVQRVEPKLDIETFLRVEAMNAAALRFSGRHGGTNDLIVHADKILEWLREPRQAELDGFRGQVEAWRANHGTDDSHPVEVDDGSTWTKL